MLLLIRLCILQVLYILTSASSMPLPFTRQLSVTNPYMNGNDVIIVQNLLIRDDAVDSQLTCDGVYGYDTETATKNFQRAHQLKVSGVLDSATAQLLLDLHSNDKIKDTGFTAASMGYLYKLYIPVYNNRSIETYATLYDGNNKELLTFRVRTHGHRDDGTASTWPDFGSTPGDIGCNEFTSSCATVTGLIEVDLNSPEPDPNLYGPYPVNRFVRGLDGNSKFLQPNIRDGILLHTGNWSTAEQSWDNSKDMPNSSGCIHAHPNDVEKIYKLLLSLGVVVNNNTFSGKNYPYKPQGIAVVSRID